MLNVPVKGISITKDANGNKTYKFLRLKKGMLVLKNYLVPIPQSEMDKGSKLEQNPGY